MRGNANARAASRAGIVPKNHLPAELRKRILDVDSDIDVPAFVRAVLLALVHCTDAATPSVTLTEIQAYLGVHHRTWLAERTIKRAIEWLVDHEVPVGSGRDGNGYFFITTDEQARIATAPLLSQAKSMLHRCARLSPKSAYFRRLLGQLEVRA